MDDGILKPKGGILSLDEARAAAAKKGEDFISVDAMKQKATKEFVLTTALTVATGVCERVYDQMSEQSAEQCAKLEAMCLQHIQVEVQKVRDEFEERLRVLEDRTLVLPDPDDTNV